MTIRGLSTSTAGGEHIARKIASLTCNFYSCPANRKIKSLQQKQHRNCRTPKMSSYNSVKNSKNNEFADSDCQHKPTTTKKSSTITLKRHVAAQFICSLVKVYFFNFEREWLRLCNAQEVKHVLVTCKVKSLMRSKDEFTLKTRASSYQITALKQTSWTKNEKD